MYSDICDEEEEDPHNDKSERYSSSTAEELVRTEGKLNSPWKSRRHAELEKEITVMSDEKACKLFANEKERQSWIEAIRVSVERNIQSQVRAVLGTPPIEKRKKLLEERLAEERRKRQLDKTNSDQKPERKTYSYPYFEEDEELMMFRRQHYLQKYNCRRTMRPFLQRADFTTRESNGRPTTLDPLSDDFNKSFSPYTRAALENAGKTSVNGKDNVYRRAVGSVWFDHNGTRHEVPGPYWPKDHLPVYPNQKHIHYIPKDVEPLNTTSESLFNILFSVACLLGVYSTR